jgi:carbonic anhydrase/acetyltransferase-like protein (isoleucine patch superfamily)
MSNITSFEGKTPFIHPDTFVDISARIIGDVIIEEGATIWPMTVIRADSSPIRIGRHTAILDHVTIEAPEGCPVFIEEDTLISHGAIIHGSIIKTNTLVGIGAIILDKVIVCQGSIIGAGSVLTAGATIPRNSLVLGVPGKVIRETTEDERKNVLKELEGLYKKSRSYTR